jgi:teichuronic acid biosynthesis glycosyltransferase TuaG
VNPLVSVIIPTYNRNTLISDCVESILTQTYKPIEIIVVDDGSTDNTCTTLEERFGNKITLISIKHTGLPAAARNIGLKAARGEFIAFCDSDDLWIETKIEIQMKYMMAGAINFVCSDALLMNEKKQYLEHLKFRYEDPNKELLWNNFVITSSVILSAKLLRSYNFNEDTTLRGYEDYALWLSLADKLKIQFIADPLVLYRRHSDSLSKAVIKKDAKIQLLLVLKFISPIYHPVIFLKKLTKFSYYFFR